MVEQRPGSRPQVDENRLNVNSDTSIQGALKHRRSKTSVLSYVQKYIILFQHFKSIFIKVHVQLLIYTAKFIIKFTAGEGQYFSSALSLSRSL